MTKLQRILLGIFLAMFVVPEVLWSPAYKMYYATVSSLKNGSYQVWRPNFLDSYGNAGLWSNLILLEFFGLFFTAIFLIIIRKNIKNRVALWIVVFIIFIFSLLILNLYRLSSIQVAF